MVNYSAMQQPTDQPTTDKPRPKRLPDWFRNKGSKVGGIRKLTTFLDSEVPNTICQEARCPNRSDCFTKGVLTFMILGTTCTRNCGFCSVAHGKPLPPDKNEVNIILNAIDKLNLKFVVITSPNRDDLPDNGSEHYAYIIRQIKEKYPEVKVEVLIPDFQGDESAIRTVVEAKPDVINHNVETVPELYRTVRKGSLYKRSLDVLKEIKAQNPSILTKSGVMVGLGETQDQLARVFSDLKDNGVDIITIGQYLKPDKTSLEVERYYHPKEFIELKDLAEEIGIRYVFSGPLVRSSYLAEHVFEELQTP